MKVWWVLSVILITLMLAGLVLTTSIPFALQAVLMVVVAVGVIVLLYFIVRRW